MPAAKPKNLHRSYAQGHFGLTIDMDGGTTAWVQSVSGGNISGEIASEHGGSESQPIKSLQNLKVEPIKFKQALGASRPIYDWIRRSWRREVARYNGSILHANFEHTVIFEQQFREALISKVTFPTLDASSNDPGYLEVEIQPEEVVLTRASGNKKLSGFEEGTVPKMWTCSSFRLSLFRGATEVDCRGVRQIESFSISQRLKELPVGENTRRFPEWEPCGIEFPDLSLTMSVGYIDDFLAWHHDFLHTGKSSAEDEMLGYIEFLSPTTGKELFTVYIDRVGVKNLTIGENTVSDSIHTAKVELYVGDMSLDINELKDSSRVKKVKGG